MSETKYYLHQCGCYDYWKIPETEAEKKADTHKLKRQTLVQCLVDALKPEAFREVIQLRVRDDPEYKYNHLKLEELILKEGEIWEHVYKSRQAAQKDKKLKDDKVKGGKTDQKSSGSKGTPTVSARVVTFKGAKCIHCKEEGHYFLKRDKKTNSYVQNCPKDAGGRFDELKRESLKQMDEKKKDRPTKSKNSSNTNRTTNYSGSGAAAKQASDEGWVQPVKELGDTLANVVSVLNEIIVAKKAETKSEKERKDVRFNLMSMSD
jgi:hypothetical protein